jgi:hypothetical protein
MQGAGYRRMMIPQSGEGGHGEALPLPSDSPSNPVRHGLSLQVASHPHDNALTVTSLMVRRTVKANLRRL